MLPYNKPGRFERGGPLVSGHTASVLDFDFNPFHEQVRRLRLPIFNTRHRGIGVGGSNARVCASFGRRLQRVFVCLCV